MRRSSRAAAAATPVLAAVTAAPRRAAKQQCAASAGDASAAGAASKLERRTRRTSAPTPPADAKLPASKRSKATKAAAPELLCSASRSFEAKWWAKGLRRVAGVDEAGRGPLAGPVVAAACIIPEDVHIVRRRCCLGAPPHTSARLLTCPCPACPCRTV